MNERDKKVLCAVIQSYINSAGPIGSRHVTKKYSFGLSPATIRNIMADLEEMGFLRQPHTSAGRIPTDIGYRFYVDLLSEEKRTQNRELLLNLYRKLESMKNDLESILDETSKVLSSFSSYLGITFAPSECFTTLTKIELIKFRRDQIAVFLFTDEGVIKNKIIRLDHELSQDDLSRISRHLSSEYAGKSLEDIRKSVASEINRDGARCDALITDAMDICNAVFSSVFDNVYVSGVSGLLNMPDPGDIRKIRELLKTIEDKRAIVNILEKIINVEGTQVFIGSELPIDEMKDFSLIISTYKEGDRPIGAIGIIGPKRMNYAKAITIVDTTAEFITRMIGGDTER